MRLIDADAFKQNFAKEMETATDIFDAVDYALEMTPTTKAYTEQDIREAYNDGYSCGKGQAEPVRPGRWEQVEFAVKNFFRCSNCKHEGYRYKSKYCPNCGAKMDGGAR